MSSIREVLAPGDLIGKRLVEITSSDPGDPVSFVELAFENGCLLRFVILDSAAYPTGFPFMLTTTEDEKPWEPNEEERLAGKWAAVESLSMEGPQFHIVPTVGKGHILSDECWCAPKFVEHFRQWWHNEE